MYRKALVAIELDALAASQVLDHACRLAETSLAGHAALRVVHVVAPQTVQYSVDPSLHGEVSESLADAALAAARDRVAELCRPFGIAPAAQIVRSGHAASEIHALAVAEDVDLIIVGSHGREGLRGLLGSTANATLHSAPVDVMTVRIHQETPADTDIQADRTDA